MPRKRKTPARPKMIGPMSTKDMTPDQITILSEVWAAMQGNARLFQLLYGGVRAGKSTAAALGTTLHSSTRQGCEYIVGAYTQRQAAAIFMPKYKMAAELLDLRYRESRAMSNPHIEIGENLFSIYGGSDSSRFKNVQGLTVAGLVLDEIPLLDREYMAQAEARTSEDGALRIYTANKVNPYHWTTKYYHNRAKQGLIKATLYDLDTSSNQHISADYIEERRSEYDDLHRTRFIDNEFALDAPPLYAPQYDDIKDVPAVSVVYGDGSVYQVLHLTSTEYGYGIGSVAEYPVTSEIEDMELGGTVLVNSDRPFFARQLRKGGRSVRAYRGEYEARRLEQTQQALSRGTIRINPDIDLLTQAIDEYSTGGIYKHPLIRTLEAAGEYVTRFKAK